MNLLDHAERLARKIGNPDMAITAHACFQGIVQWLGPLFREIPSAEDCSHDGADRGAVAIRVKTRLHRAADGFPIITFATEKPDRYNHGIADRMTPMMNNVFIPQGVNAFDSLIIREGFPVPIKNLGYGFVETALYRDLR